MSPYFFGIIWFFRESVSGVLRLDRKFLPNTLHFRYNGQTFKLLFFSQLVTATVLKKWVPKGIQSVATKIAIHFFFSLANQKNWLYNTYNEQISNSKSLSVLNLKK